MARHFSCGNPATYAFVLVHEVEREFDERSVLWEAQARTKGGKEEGVEEGGGRRGGRSETCMVENGEDRFVGARGAAGNAHKERAGLGNP